MTISPHKISETIAALQAHQDVLGETVVQIAREALYHRLADIEHQGPQNLLAERKQVTVMFADISGFTALSEKLDPEDVRNLINACFERLGAVITRYDGYIDKFIGDEIMALFGAPITHENDAERALRAALEMKEALAEFNAHHASRLPQPLALHFGVNTGLVIAGGIGTCKRQDYSVIGDAVNLASRLEGLSKPGEILVGEDTYRLTAPLFEFETLKPTHIKGKTEPVPVYRLWRVKPEPGPVRGIQDASSPLVGRRQEMKQLKAALTDLHRGTGRVVSVMGEAGIGKSRLVRELQQHCLNDSKDVWTRWATGRAVSHGENISYLMTRDLLINLLPVGRAASPVETGVALQKELDRVAPDEASTLYPFLAHLLDVPLDEETAQQLNILSSEALHRQMLNAVRRYLNALTQIQPLVLVWEDLHWADPSSLEILETLLPLTREHPLLLILIYRLRRESRIWTFHERLNQLIKDRHLSVMLSPLTITDGEQLIDNLIGAQSIPPHIRRLILSKAEGNPFYLEEVLRSLIDRQILVRAKDGDGWVMTTTDIEDIQIPDTLQGVIMARIDRLSPDVKRTLQVASVIGRTFLYKVLARVLENETDEGTA